ncbi:hypothetical protein HBA55_34540 [Pseudomaricurvus alkylphenolicus]|uniref:hypothetical protein n=1 Tax=Pseudomaricurvus alkylphenolicus TaxID=1306991 RepID=UPI0014232A4A|nr:hypothetical protein [Pseudomaricurvus alkylphenolicus]NIB44750.1 hypothetical protein [Pseudomaricurvus alkylphenolicus]
MKTFVTDCQAGIAQDIGGAKGSYFRILSGDGDVKVTFFFTNGDSYRTGWKVGIGAPTMREFKRILIESSITQRMEVAWSTGPINDNRLNGNLEINGGVSIKANKTAAHGAVSVGTSATLVVAENLGRGRCLLQNLGGSDCYVGNSSGVTTANGIKLVADGTMEVSFDDTVYAITATGTADVRYLEETV